MRGKSIQCKVMDVLHEQQKPLSAYQVAMILDINIDQAELALAGLFDNSKVERRRDQVPVYRLPGEHHERTAQEPQLPFYLDHMARTADVRG
ncbi:MAG: hypothetical protein ACE5D3_04625 [Candidatus Binatia bacterium]